MSGAEQYVVIHIKNLGDVVKKQGGAAGGLAYSLLPQTVTNKAYSTLREKLIEGFRAEGVDADVAVVSSPVGGTAAPQEFLIGALVGAGGLGVGWLLWKYLLKGWFK